MRRNTKLRGVAFSTWVTGEASDKVMTQSYVLITAWLEFGHHRPHRYPGETSRLPGAFLPGISAGSYLEWMLGNPARRFEGVQDVPRR